MYTEFWWGNLRVREHLVDPGVDGGLVLRYIFRKWSGPGSSVGIATGYGLDGPGIESR